MKAERLRPVAAYERSADIARARSTVFDKWALARIQSSVRSAPIRFALWDGFELQPDSPAVATIAFTTRASLWSWVWDPDMNFGEEYMSGGVEIRGDLVALLEAIYRALTAPRSGLWRLWEKANDLHASRRNVHHHYDLGNDFYRLWLDREMV